MLWAYRLVPWIQGRGVKAKEVDLINKQTTENGGTT